jgi:hypothetical protein
VVKVFALCDEDSMDGEVKSVMDWRGRGQP